MHITEWNEFLPDHEEEVKTIRDLEPYWQSEGIVSCRKCGQKYELGHIAPYDYYYISEDGKLAKAFFFESDLNGDPNTLEVHICTKCGVPLGAMFGALGMDEPLFWNNYNE